MWQQIARWRSQRCTIAGKVLEGRQPCTVSDFSLKDWGLLALLTALHRDGATQSSGAVQVHTMLQTCRVLDGGGRPEDEVEAS